MTWGKYIYETIFGEFDDSNPMNDLFADEAGEAEVRLVARARHARGGIASGVPSGQVGRGVARGE